MKRMLWIPFAVLCGLLTACTINIHLDIQSTSPDSESEITSDSTASSAPVATIESTEIAQEPDTALDESNISELTDALLALFTEATGYGASAGASLRNLLNARNYLAFAEEMDYSHINAAIRSMAASAAFASMEPKEQAMFLYNFQTIQNNVEHIFEDPVSMERWFYDVGISLDDLEDLLEPENAREQWDALSADLHSLGNLDDYVDIAEGMFPIGEEDP